MKTSITTTQRWHKVRQHCLRLGSILTLVSGAAVAGGGLPTPMAAASETNTLAMPPLEGPGRHGGAVTAATLNPMLPPGASSEPAALRPPERRALAWGPGPELPGLADAAAYLPGIDQPVRLVLRLGKRRVFVYEGDREVASYPVAIGKSGTPTPTGEFKVFQLIENPVWQSPWTGRITEPGPDSALGLRWIGFAEMSNGIIGFHGTPTVNSIGRAASNGCVRMYNRDVLELFDRVEMGTPVTVEP